MAKGMSIHVGVNATQAPGISTQPLRGCENDAEEMRKLARSRGFVKVPDDQVDDLPIVGNQATFDNVLGKIHIAANELQAGDIFLFTFSGHGTRRGAEDPTETDFKDETLVLSDKLLVDNVLRRRIWPTFKAGVRVVMVSDSCHSGGIAMAPLEDPESEEGEVAWAGNGGGGVGTGAMEVIRRQEPRPSGFRIRAVSEAEASAHFDLLAPFYKALRESFPPGPAPQIDGKVLLLAACAENQTTRDGLPHGVFTQALLDVWQTNTSQTYEQLRKSIEQRLQNTANSLPVIVTVGEAPAFDDTEAFRI